jgi:hypothetical protein
MAKKHKSKAKTESATALNPPPGGAVVRMYRIGHRDCFLIAFAGQQADKPAWLLRSRTGL